MKIAIATDHEDDVAAHFGRCRGFWVIDHDVSDSRPTFRPNPGGCGQKEESAHGHEGEGHARKVALLADCEMVIAGGMGPGIRAAFQAAGIRTVLTDCVKVQDVVQSLREGRLSEKVSYECCHGKGSCGGQGS